MNINEKEDPSVEELEKRISLELRELLNDNLFIHIKKLAKAYNKLQFFVLQTEPFVKDFIYAEVVTDNDSLTTEQQTMMIVNNILSNMRLNFILPATG